MPNDARIEELAKGAHIPCGSTQDCLAKIEEALRTAIREAREEQIHHDLSLMARYGLRGQECYAQMAAQLPTKKG